MTTAVPYLHCPEFASHPSWMWGQGPTGENNTTYIYTHEGRDAHSG